MDSKLFIVSGTSSKYRIVDIAAICRILDKCVCLALPGLHAISACNRVSAFSGKVQSKVFDLVSKNPNFRQTLCKVGDGFVIPNGLLLDVENFTCAVYRFPSTGDINEVRFPLFCE